MGKKNMVLAYGTNDKGNRLCKECLTYQHEDNFYNSHKYPDGKMYKCKTCFEHRRKTSRLEWEKNRIIKRDLNTLPEVEMARMTVCSKEDYRLMYEFLKGIGYDPAQDIAKQFAEKWGVKYKERKPADQSYYLSNGKKNPLHRTWKGDE